MGFVHNEFLVIITNHACSIQCTDCANFTHTIPFGKSNNYTHTYQSYSVSKLLSAALRTNQIQIQGGEATLHKDLDLLPDIIKNSEISDNIEFVTNATQKSKQNLFDS